MSHPLAMTSRIIIMGRIIETLMHARHPLTVHKIIDRIRPGLPYLRMAIQTRRILRYLITLKNRGVVEHAGTIKTVPFSSPVFLWRLKK